MVSRKILIVFLSSLILLSSGSVFAQTGSVNIETEATETNQVENIGNTIKEKTPNFIARPILYVVGKIDGFREKIKILIEARKAETMAELNAPATSEEETAETNTTKDEFFKSFKYLEIFILTLLLFIFSIKFLYYAFFALLILTIIRFFWLRIY